MCLKHTCRPLFARLSSGVVYNASRAQVWGGSGEARRDEPCSYKGLTGSAWLADVEVVCRLIEAIQQSWGTLAENRCFRCGSADGVGSAGYSRAADAGSRRQLRGQSPGVLGWGRGFARVWDPERE